jgi:SAM-dependent methyltransferase
MLTTMEHEKHLSADPSAWVIRFAALVRETGDVRDVACGNGRHTRLFLSRGNAVVAVDNDRERLAEIADAPGLTKVAADLEAEPWPFPGRTFTAVVVTNYLWRPLLPALIDAVADRGVLIYETFAQGHERIGPPRDPEHLLKPGELLETVAGKLTVVAYEFGGVPRPRPAIVERICAVRANLSQLPGQILPGPTPDA